MSSQGHDAAKRQESAKQIAKRLGVVERTVRRWIAEGSLPAVKEHGQFWIDPDDAQARFDRSRAARSTQQAEWRGRYLEVKDRLEQVEAQLLEERKRALRLEAVLYPPAKVALDVLTGTMESGMEIGELIEARRG